MKIGSVEINLFDEKNSYNDAANNERMVELPLAKWFLERHNYSDIIEIGAVTPYYFESNHLVFDPFDTHERCIRLKAENIVYKGKILLSISTIEHIRLYGDYNLPVEDDDTALQVLLNMMMAREYIITFPRRFNKKLDDFVEQDERAIKLERVGHREWEKVGSLVDKVFNYPYSCGNGLYIITNCEDLLNEH